MNAIPPKGLKPGRTGPTRSRARPGEPGSGVAIAVDADGADPVPELLDDSEGMPDPAVFEAFMPKGPQAGEATAEALDEMAGPGPSGRETEAAQRRSAEGGAPGGRVAAAGPAGGAIPANLAGIEVVVSVEVGRTRLPLGELLEVEPGQLFDLESLVEEPVSILVNGRPFATGEIMAVGDRFGVRIVALEDPGA